MATFASFSTQLVKRVRAIDPAWRWALGVFIIARVVYTVWSVVALLLAPSVLQNLNLFGAPVVAYFDLSTSERFVYARQVGERVLVFRGGDAGIVTDVETQSEWSVRDGVALRGALAGTRLQTSAYTTEDVFPYRGVAAERGLLGLWQRFDTNWFLAIAQNGYDANAGSTVYMPLYPLLIRAGGIVLGNYLWAALVISNVALVIALALLFRQTRQVFDESVAPRALIYLIIFPTAFFFLAAYTESLFLALALASLLAAEKKQFGWASVWAALAALTRLQGILLLAPLLYLVWVHVAERKFQITRQVLRALLALALIPFVTIAFMVYTNLSLLASYEGELHARFVLPWENIFAAANLILQARASVIDIFNLLVTIFFGAMIVFVWKKLPRALALYALVMFLAPLFRMTTEQPLVSMLRYVLILFPVFMLWAKWGENAWVNRAIVYPSILLALYFSAQFWTWGWVA